MVVRYISSHSSSCKFFGDINNIRKGMQVRYRIRIRQNESKEIKQLTQKKELVANNSRKKSRYRKLRGSFRIGYYLWDDQNATNLDFRQPSAYGNLQYSPEWNENLSVHIKFRARRNYRSRVLNREVSKTEWRNRVYQFYVSYDPSESGIIFKAGRIVENDLTGVGYLDGIIVGISKGNGHRVGMIAGTRPEWHYAEPQAQIQKYGIFYSKKYSLSHLRGVTSFAINGEYHSSTVSREYLSFYHSSRIGSKIYLYFFNELDYNRDWRKERSKSTIGISNLYFSLQYNWRSWLRGGISLDQRKNYWTYDYYSIADSLFDQSARRGIRIHLSSRLPGNYHISLQTGLTKRESESQPTISGSLNLSKTNILHKRINIFFNTMYFHNPFLDGINMKLQIGKPITNKLNSRIGVRYYAYQNNSFRSQNVLFSVGNDFYFFRNISITHWIGIIEGDDEKGIRTWIELGYYF
jgi:hypothetical protein